MKKILFAIAAILSILFIQMPSAEAAAVKDATQPDTALFIQLDPTNVGKPSEAEKLIYDDFASELKKAGHIPVAFENSQKTLRIYLREEAEVDTQREQDLGVVLKSKDFKALAVKENVRYVMLVATRTTSAETKFNFWSGSRKNVTVLTNIVLYDAQAEDYLADQSYTEIGKTSGSYDRAYIRATKKLLQEVKAGDLYKGSF